METRKYKMQHAFINVLPVEKGDFVCLYVLNSNAGCLVFKHKEIKFWHL